MLCVVCDVWRGVVVMVMMFCYADDGSEEVADCVKKKQESSLPFMDF